MADMDPIPGIVLSDAQTSTGRTRAPRAKPAWVIGLGVAVILLAALIAYGLAHFDAARWVPEGGARPPVAPLRAPIVEGLVRGKDDGPHRIDYKRLDARITRLSEKKEIVGLAVGIVENGRLSFVKGYGVTEAGHDDRVTANTVFRWASVSKGLAATLVAQLAQQKRLSLQDPVSRYAPSLKLPGGGEHVATIDNLLSHRLGIVHNAYDDKLEEGLDPKAIRSSLFHLDRYCAPGTCWGYQNVAFDAASEIVETVTKQPYGDVVRQRLFAPLGMRSASTTKAGLESAPSWARPHVGRREVPVEDAYYRIPAAGGVNSSIFDMSIWLLAQMGRAPSILPPALLDEIHRPRVDSAKRRRGRFDVDMRDGQYALGWRDVDYHGHRLIAHRGAVRGYRSMILFDPVLQAGIVALWNSESNRPVGIQMEMLDMLYGMPAKDWLELDKDADRDRDSE